MILKSHLRMTETLSYHQTLSAQFLYTLSGRIGKVVVSHPAVARSSPAEIALIYTMHEALRGYCP